jgi:hypothetical protein
MQYVVICRVPYGTQNGGVPIPMWREKKCLVDHKAHISTTLESLAFCLLSRIDHQTKTDGGWMCQEMEAVAAGERISKNIGVGKNSDPTQSDFD